MKKRFPLIASVLALISVSLYAVSGFYAWGQASYPLPTYPTETVVNPTDLLDVIPNGAPGPTRTFLTAPTLAGYVGSLPAKANYLIGGDATTNLWQRSTAGTAATTTVAYGSADRWASWSGTSTEVKVIRDSTAADLPGGYQYAFKMQRTSGQTGVVQTCMLQAIESANSYSLAGSTAELDFHAAYGANFSAASKQMTAYIITGTGADEGVAGTSSVAYGLNAGGGGSGSWTTQANATAAVITLVPGVGRYAAIGAIPAGTTEVAVALCFKPVGTAGTNDYVAFSGIQLVRTQLAANTTAGFDCSTTTGGNGTQIGTNAANVQCAAYDRYRSITAETLLQQRYYWQINEPAASLGVGEGGTYETTTICGIPIKNPVTMRVAPTVTIGGTSEGVGTWAIISKSQTPVALATTYLVQDATIGNTAEVTNLSATTASTTAGFACRLVGAGGGANIQASAEL